MAKSRSYWFVESPSGVRTRQPSRAAARAYIKSQGGARASGYRSNETAHRRESIEQRKRLGFTEIATGQLERLREGSPEAITSTTLFANWRLALRSGDLQAASRFEEGVRLVFDYENGSIDREEYRARMKEIYQYALEHGYVEKITAFRDYLYYGQG